MEWPSYSTGYNYIQVLTSLHFVCILSFLLPIYVHPGKVTPIATEEYLDNLFYKTVKACGVSWPSGLAYRTQVLVLAAECGFESRPWHLCPWARHLTVIASLQPGVKWVPVRAELVD